MTADGHGAYVDHWVGEEHACRTGRADHVMTMLAVKLPMMMRVSAMSKMTATKEEVHDPGEMT